MKIIILADAVMSLDNVIALVGVSAGNLLLLGMGLLLTIPLVVWGSTLLSTIMDRLPVLAYAGAALLAYVALDMIFEDRAAHGFLEHVTAGFETFVKLAVTASFVAAAWLWLRRVEGSRETGPS